MCVFKELDFSLEHAKLPITTCTTFNSISEQLAQRILYSLSYYRWAWIHTIAQERYVPKNKQNERHDKTCSIIYTCRNNQKVKLINKQTHMESHPCKK